MKRQMKHSIGNWNKISPITSPCSHEGLQLTKYLLKVQEGRVQEISLRRSWSVWQTTSWQLLSEPLREAVPLDLLFVNRERLLGNVTAGGHLRHSDYQMIDFFQTADLVLFMRLAERVLWEAILKGKGVQEGWTCFKEDILKLQEQTIHMFQVMSQRARRPTCLNKELWLEIREKKNYNCWWRGRQLRKSKRMFWCCGGPNPS